MNKFNKSQIKSNFNNAAKIYKEKARLQKIVAKKFIELNFENIAGAKNILDLGSGPGLLLNMMPEKLISHDKNFFQLDLAYEMLKKGKNQRNIFNINADIDFLPFKEDSFDLVISSLSLQWLGDLSLVFRKIIPLLKKNGSFSCAIIIDGSLKELKIAKEKCHIDLAVNNFVSFDYISKLLSTTHNSNFVIKTETIILDYEDLYDLLKSIKAIGAGYSGNKQKLLTKNDFKKLNDFYLQNFKLGGKVKASWQVCFLKLAAES